MYFISYKINKFTLSVGLSVKLQTNLENINNKRYKKKCKNSFIMKDLMILDINKCIFVNLDKLELIHL